MFRGAGKKFFSVTTFGLQHWAVLWLWGAFLAAMFHVKHWLISRRYFSLKIGSGVLLCASALRLDRTGAIALQVEATLKLTQ